MLFGALAASLLGSALAGHWVIRAGEVTIRVGQNFWCCLVLGLIFKLKNITKTNLNLMAFVQEIT